MRNIVFFHIPRTAGSSLNHMLSVNFGNAYYPLADKDGSHAAGIKIFDTMSPVEQNRYRCISGHMPMAFLDRIPWPFKTVTFLRNPLDRVPSVYAFYMSVDTHPSRESWRKRGITLREWVEECNDPEAVNGMTRRLAGGPGTDQEMLQRAKANLSRFSYVGLQENYAASLVALAHLFKLEHVNHIKRNQSIYRSSWTPCTKELEIVRRTNQLDLELYEYGRELHRIAMATAGPVLKAKIEAFLTEKRQTEQNL